MTPEARQLLDAAATYLRTLSLALRGAGDVDASSPEREAFFAAQDSWANHAGERERVVPIAELFYEDGGPGVVEPAQNPPTSVSERFRLELVSLGEHLRQVVDTARRASDVASVNRARRDLRGALRALQAAAASFGEREVAEFVAGHAGAADDLDFHGLATLDDLASLLADPGVRGERLRERLREVAGRQDSATFVGAGNADEPDAEFTARLTPLSSERQAPPQSTNGSAASLIDSSIAALDALGSNPFSDPIPIPEDTVVPIESLLYRGRAALDRAVEIRDEIRGAGTNVDPGALEELFDLLDLARVE
jgi:hypothetical protein